MLVQDPILSSLYTLALSEVEPTNCYALQLLGSMLDNPELLYVTKQRNIELVSVVLKRLVIYSEALDREMVERKLLWRYIFISLCNRSYWNRRYGL